MALAQPLAHPFNEGSGTSLEVPGLYDVALNGRPYMLDWQYVQQQLFTRESIRLLKPQVDDSGEISERSLNPEEFARQGQDSWHKGAGQQYVDRADSDPARFRESKGVDVWERWELSLLPDTSSQTASANTNLAVLTAGSYLYEADGNDVYHRSAIDGSRTSAVIHVAESPQSVKSITTDGFYVYAALGSNGIHRTERGASSSAHYSDLSCTLVGYEKGRLMAANGNAIYNVTASGAAPAALFTHPNSDFTWVGFASGLGQVYAAGYSGSTSLVYRTAVKADGTALDTPVVAGQLPDGEVIRSIKGYLGFILLGTDEGVRFAVADDAGNLTIGALIDLDVSVRCFEGQGRFVWFGWENYDGTSTGLGRLDLTVLNGTAPAYASDLMATGQGQVLSVCTFADRRVFAVSGLGIYAEDTDLVSSGTLDTGLITYGLPDNKVAMYVDVRTQPLDGSVSVALAKDGGSFATLGSHATADATMKVIPAGHAEAETFELRWTLSRAATTTLGPVITRTTLEANPAPGRGKFVTLPLLLAEKFERANGSQGEMDPKVEREALDDMESSGAPIALQTGEGVETVFLEDSRFVARSYTSRRDAFNGTYLARVKKPRSRSI